MPTLSDKTCPDAAGGKILLKNVFTVPSNSAWSSPSLLVLKSNQTPCFCSDYHKLNVIMKPDFFSANFHVWMTVLITWVPLYISQSCTF